MGQHQRFLPRATKAHRRFLGQPAATATGTTASNHRCRYSHSKHTAAASRCRSNSRTAAASSMSRYSRQAAASKIRAIDCRRTEGRRGDAPSLRLPDAFNSAAGTYNRPDPRIQPRDTARTSGDAIRGHSVPRRNDGDATAGVLPTGNGQHSGTGHRRLRGTMCVHQQLRDRRRYRVSQ